MKLFQIFFLLLSLALPQFSFALDRIEGRVLRVDKEILIYISPGNRLVPLTAVTALDQRALGQLESGDFVTGQGWLSRNEARLESLYFVGLQRLLGLWRSRNWEVFEFRTYEDLRLYRPVDSKNQNPLGPLVIEKKFSYNLSPGMDSRWAMLLVDADSVELARLEFRNNKLHFHLLERETGKIKHTFQLTQIALKQPHR